MNHSHLTECPECGTNCNHTVNEKTMFAYDALELAAQQARADETRGASWLIGKTIVAVNTAAINQIILTDDKGHRYTIDTVGGPLGIPVIIIEKE